MRIGAAFRQYLTDEARQRRLRDDGAARTTAWTASADGRRLRATLQSLAAAPPDDATELADAWARWTNNTGWLDSLIAPAMAAIAADPFADVGLMMQVGPAVTALELLSVPGARLTLCLVDGAAIASVRQQRVAFGGGLTLVHLLGNRPLIASLHRRDRSTGRLCPAEPVVLAPGGTWTGDGAVEQLEIRHCVGDALFLRLTVERDAAPAPLNEYATTTGQLVRTITADPAISHILCLLDFVCRLPSTPRSDALALAARYCAHTDAAVRWQAMRYRIALDPSKAARSLAAMAEGDQDPAVRLVAAQTMRWLDGGMACPQN